MLTNFVENNKKKADKYWPDAGQSLLFENVKVVLLRLLSLVHLIFFSLLIKISEQPETKEWCLRKFQVTDEKKNIKKQVFQVCAHFFSHIFFNLSSFIHLVSFSFLA